MQKKNSISSILAVSFLITGCSVGSGLLAMPICIGLLGFYPGIVLLFVSWIFMTSTGFILAKIVIEHGNVDFDLPSIYGSILGENFKWVAIVANMIIMYGLLVAYLAGLTSILSSIINIDPFVLTIFIFIIVTSVNYFSVNVIKKSNSISVVILLISFFILIIIAGINVNPVNFKHINYLYILLPLPVLVNSFNFHNMVPLSCKILKFDKKSSYLAIIIGVGLSLILNVIWCFVVLGVLSYNDTGSNSILFAFNNNLPATIPLSFMIKSNVFNIFALLFSVIALLTSYWTFGAALTGFLDDLRNTYYPIIKSRKYDFFMAFIPPLVITLLCPDVFIKIQGIVGGVGIAILFGVIPSYIYLKRTTGLKKLVPHFMVIFFSCVCIYSILHRFGLPF